MHRTPARRKRPRFLDQAMESNVNPHEILIGDTLANTSSTENQLINASVSADEGLKVQNNIVAILQQMLALESELKKVQGKFRENEAETFRLKLQLENRMLPAPVTSKTVYNSGAAANAVTSAGRVDAVTLVAVPLGSAPQVVHASAVPLFATSYANATSAGDFTAPSSTFTNATNFIAQPFISVPCMAPSVVTSSINALNATNGLLTSSIVPPCRTDVSANAAADVTAYTSISATAASGNLANAARINAYASAAPPASVIYTASAADFSYMHTQFSTGLSSALLSGIPQAPAIPVSLANALTGPRF